MYLLHERLAPSLGIGEVGGGFPSLRLGYHGVELAPFTLGEDVEYLQRDVQEISAAVGVTLDTHFLMWERRRFGVDEAEAFRIAGGKLGHLHIQDGDFRAPGTGSADFRGFIEAVKAVHWDGYISFETLGITEEGLGERMAAECIVFMRE